jgi:hypothetical protein
VRLAQEHVNCWGEKYERNKKRDNQIISATQGKKKKMENSESV